MKKFIASFILVVASAGCCIGVRSWKIDKEIPLGTPLGSGMYVTYTNCTTTTRTIVYTSGETDTQIVPDGTIYKYCNNHLGPWSGSDIYPGTRATLNALSFMSYSSPASGDYMLNIIILPCYPIVLCELPIQSVLDTILLPWDILTAPTCPEGYARR